MTKYALIVFVLFLIGSAGGAETRSDVQTKCIDLNNEGVKAMNHKDYQQAHQKFEGALKLDPNYQLAKDNIVVTHGQYGDQLSQEHKYPAAIKELHLAAYAGGDHWSEELSQSIEKMGKNPKHFQDRVELGDQARDGGDWFGAIVEYRAALQLKDDASVRRRLGVALNSIGDKANAEVEFGVAKWIDQRTAKKGEPY